MDYSNSDGLYRKLQLFISRKWVFNDCKRRRGYYTILLHPTVGMTIELSRAESGPWGWGT